jgi:hypothetical protein
MYHDNILKNIAPSTFNYWELTNSASIYFSLVVEKKLDMNFLTEKRAKEIFYNSYKTNSKYIQDRSDK